MDSRPRRSRRAALALTLGLVLMSPAAAVEAQARPAPASDLRAAAAQKRLETAGLQRALDAVTAGDGVGAVAEVVGPGRKWSSASGVRRLSGRQPAARAGDRVRIASVTKSMVATLALQEVERGRWTLSTRVRDVLPGLLPGHGNVSLAQLLSHRSGLPDYLPALVADAESTEDVLDELSTRRTDRELVRLALTLPWSFEPGESFGYSNTNYVVVGLMLAEVNHRSVGSLLERRVFRPARMTDSSFPRTAKVRGPHLREYAKFEDSYTSLASFEPSVFSSAGAVVSTARDVNRFYAALSTGRLLRPGLVRQMRQPRSTEPLVYGLGIYSLPDPCPTADGKEQLVYGHDGASFGTFTVSLSSPDGRRQVTVAMTGRDFNVLGADPALGEFAYLALLASCPTAPDASRQRVARAGAVPAPWLDLAATAQR
jgi:D-alanyl-D-alanine carboxypeptidase